MHAEAPTFHTTGKVGTPVPRRDTAPADNPFATAPGGC